jgi:hypothetical protein
MSDMANRRPPIATSLKSTVAYPSALFALERDEVLPFERFAYNILDVAISALHAKSMPERVAVEFSNVGLRISPWIINASVQCELDPAGRPTGFRFVIPELVPSLVYIFCQKLGAELVETGTSDIRQNLQRFVDGASAGVREYKQHGLGHAVRASYDYYGLTISDYSRAQHSFDLLTKLVAYHEIGHAYAGHLSSGQDIDPVTRRGFELIADLLATTWFYNGYIRNTPDDSGYREMRGLASHSEAIFTNSIEAQRAQLTLLTLMAFAGAQQNGGRPTVSGGISHSPGIQRHMLQHVHLGTLIKSNFAQLLSNEQFAALQQDWNKLFECLIESGIIPVSDVMNHLDPQECDTIEAASNAIESMNVQELKPAVPFLLEIRELQGDALAGRRPSFFRA